MTVPRDAIIFVPYIVFELSVCHLIALNKLDMTVRRDAIIFYEHSHYIVIQCLFSLLVTP